MRASVAATCPSKSTHIYKLKVCISVKAVTEQSSTHIMHTSKLQRNKGTLKLEGNYMHDLLAIHASKSVLLK